MYYIDTHTHLFAEQFDDDINETVERAIVAGVKKMILPCIDRERYNNMLLLAQQYPHNCYPTIGLHPTSVNENYQTELDFITNTINKHKFVAVGEIGIDCYWSLDFIEQQRHAFAYQLNLAAKHNLPVIIHARDSFHEIFAILDNMPLNGLRGVFHSFSGTISDYQKIKAYQTFKIGIGGVLTYKKSTLADVVKKIDLQDIILETDSPYLPPVPHRGKRNESAYIPLIAEKIAEIKNIDLTQIAEVTTANANKLFTFE